MNSDVFKYVNARKEDREKEKNTHGIGKHIVCLCFV